MSEYAEAVNHYIGDLDGVSTGICPGCPQCASDHGHDPESPSDMAAFEAGWHSGEVYDEGGCSWAQCGVCGTRLGGDRYVWHWLDEDGQIMHETDCCTDCVLFLANGDEPEEWS